MEGDKECEDSQRGTKRRKKTEETRVCLIHCTSDSSSLVRVRDIESWETLLRAAQIRNHEGLIEISENISVGEVPDITYHRQCRSEFTMKSKLDAILKRECINDTEPQIMYSSTRTRTPLNLMAGFSSPLLSPVCIFCDKINKYKSGTKTREPLVKCVEKRAEETIKARATEKEDSKLLGLLSTRDLIAAEAQYHFSCYRNYTRLINSKNMDAATNLVNEHEDTVYDNGEFSAFEELQEYINELCCEPSVVYFVDVTKRYVQSILTSGVKEVKYHTKKNLRRRIEQVYGSRIRFTMSDSGKLLMFPDTLTREELVRKNENLTSKLKEIHSSSQQQVISTALQLKKDIQALQKNSKPTVLPAISDLFATCNNRNEILPESVRLFLTTLLTADRSKGISEKVSRFIWSFGQDLVFGVTNGHVKTSKHILLPFALKSLNGRICELTRLINRCGHGLSYHQIEEIETAIAVQKIGEGTEQGLAIPENIIPGKFTNLVWDNIDRLEETLSGAGTTHRVNGIAIQFETINEIGFTVPEIVPIKKKQRTIMVMQNEPVIYNPGKRVGPILISTEDPLHEELVLKSKLQNLLWLMLRSIDPKHQLVPSWTGFNILLWRDRSIQQTSIGYLPTINSPASSMNTIHEILTRSLRIKEKLELHSLPIFADQAIYAKAAEIVWKHPDKYKSIVLNLGGFHITCNFLGIIGKRFEDSGLPQLLSESDAIAEGSISGVLLGKHYNRGVRMHKLAFEALMRIILVKFSSWAESKHEDTVTVLHELGNDIAQLYEEIGEATSENFSQMLSQDATITAGKMFEEYLNFLRTQNGDLSSFWMSYIDMVDILLMLIRATREGNWSLYLASIRKMIPWCFAYDHINYARYLPVYYNEMVGLKEKHPSVYEAFQKGYFSAQIGKANPFGRIPADQVIEETVNKDTQGPSGTIKFSTRQAAVQRYYLVSDARANFLQMLRVVTDSSFKSSIKHPDLSPSRIQKDEGHVSLMTDILSNEWTDPFNESDLVNIASGILAPKEVRNDLLTAYEKGEEAYAVFKERLHEEVPSQTFFSPMRKLNLKSFSYTKKTKGIKVKEKEVILKSDRGLFAQMAIIAQKRNLDMKLVLSYPLGPLPWSLATPQGTIRKTAKSKLMDMLSRTCEPAEEISLESSVYIVDGMSQIHKLLDIPKTFGLLAEKLFTKILHESTTCPRVDIVFDTYRPVSIKNSERMQRASEEAMPVQNIQNIMPAHPVKNWKRFLSNNNNKSELISFLWNEWRNPTFTEKLRNKVIFLTCNEECCKLSSTSAVENVSALHSSQEEADTRLVLHAFHALNSGFFSIIIQSDDTDVAVIILSTFPEFSKRGGNIYLKMGTSNRLRYHDMDVMYRANGASICAALAGLHSITGCDTVSAFAGKGKAKAFKLLKDEAVSHALTDLADGFELQNETVEAIEKVVCRLYGHNVCSVNELRYSLFCAKKGFIESHLLPPCKQALDKHIQRASYQATIWKKALEAEPNIPDPTLHGWTSQDSNGTTVLDIDWMDCHPAPEAVMELLACSCKVNCVPNVCVCIKYDLRCTDMCKIQTCKNYKQDTENGETNGDFSDSDNSSDIE